MGTVYLAVDETLDRPVAVKVPRRGMSFTKEGSDSHLYEARTIARLRHPAIVPIFDVGLTDDGMPYLVTEYIEGRTLRDILYAERVPYARCAELMAEIADAIHHAHVQGFVHRDLKPGNVIIDAQGKPHILDFGLALHDTSRRASEGEVAGTPIYMSPEQIRGETQQLDGRTDIWAMGVVLYELLTGRRPFSGTGFQEIAYEILHREPTAPRQIDDEIPADLERICLKCLRKDVADRYVTAADFARDLRT